MTDSTVLLCRIAGPVLLLRALSIAIDRRHFETMVAGLEREVDTVTFSFFPIALLMVCLGLGATYHDTSSLAALLLQAMIWIGAIKATALILWPRAVVQKARILLRAGFLGVVLIVCCVVGGCFTWVGWVAHH